jgi:GNAT superfamily N-acetyltransferase
MAIEIRSATKADLPLLERRCWRGGEEEMRARIAAQGTCSIIALDDGRPVAQLYLRAYQPGFRSPGGLHDGAWWADLSGVPDAGELPARTVMLGCWHVGRLRDPDGSEREDDSFRGRGIGTALLDTAIAWLRSPDAPFDALAAKAADTEQPSYLGWLGGLPLSIFEVRGFRRVASFDDPYLRAEPAAVPDAAATENPARFHLVVLGGPPVAAVPSPTPFPNAGRGGA